MSGGSGAAPWFTAAQFESGFDVLLASVRTAASMIGGVTVPPGRPFPRVSPRRPGRPPRRRRRRPRRSDRALLA